MGGMLLKLLKWQGHITYYVSLFLLLIIAVYDDSRLFTTATGYIQKIYPRHVIGFFEQFYNFYLHILSCYIFIGVCFFIILFVKIFSCPRTIQRFVSSFVVFCFFHYFLLPFISIISNVFLNEIGPPMDGARGLSYFQIGCSWFYLTIVMFTMVDPARKNTLQSNESMKATTEGDKL